MFSPEDTVLRLEGFGHNNIPFGSSEGRVSSPHALISQCHVGSPNFGVCCVFCSFPVGSREEEYRAVISEFVETTLVKTPPSSGFGAAPRRSKEALSAGVEREMIEFE